MMQSTLNHDIKPQAMSDIHTDIATACRQIPPLWPLGDYVAVNPYLGFTNQPLPKAVKTVEAGLDASVLPTFDYYRGRWSRGDFGPEHLATAAKRYGLDATPLTSIMTGEAAAPGDAENIHSGLTLAERVDATTGSDWHDHAIRAQARWCSTYATAQGSGWGLAQSHCGLYASWREAAGVDLTMEIAGLPGWRRWVSNLPANADDAITMLAGQIDMPVEHRVTYFYRLLCGLYGWACHFRRSSWASVDAPLGDLTELLVIRLCADVAVAKLSHSTSMPSTTKRTNTTSTSTHQSQELSDELARSVLQEALEEPFAQQLIGSFNQPPVNPHDEQSGQTTRPSVQAAFCIDVRSEPLRRHLESQSSDIQTIGFAGFFGVALGLVEGECPTSPRCPVLLSPAVNLKSKPAQGLFTNHLASMLQHIKAAPAATFSFVEVLGLGYAARLAADTAAGYGSATAGDKEAAMPLVLNDSESGFEMSTEQRTDAATSILKNMGFHKTFARIVLLCGHTGRSANNAHAASLDCGACGGHGGAINARIAAAILNDPAVRRGLHSRGVDVPADTHFLPAVHDTSCDSVTLLDVDQLPETHTQDRVNLQASLAKAGAAVQAERAGALGLGHVHPSRLDRVLKRRARDWSQVRPEWALARNAAFVAARRCRTRQVNLAGRVFLHDYDASLDTDASVLSLILCAPMVVASWINLQYFASTVDNNALGCGDKALHNRLGSLGVVLGNGGDLRTGLAAQSVHAADGSWHHEPLRLQVVVEAPPERIDAVLAKHQQVADLVNNHWIRLFALDPNSDKTWLNTSVSGWEQVGQAQAV